MRQWHYATRIFIRLPVTEQSKVWGALIAAIDSFYPYFEGSKPSLTRQELAKLNDKTVPYQGKQIPQEEALAIQRSYERQVKRWKREESVAKGALPLMAPDQTKAKAKIKEYQGKLRAFTEETGLKRDYTRERM